MGVLDHIQEIFAQVLTKFKGLGPSLLKLPETLKELIKPSREGPKIFTGISEKFRELRAFISGFMSGEVDVGEKRRKLILAGLGGLTLILVLILVGLIRTELRASRTAKGDVISEAFKPQPIPGEELFLPEEPDFLPKILPEREQRNSWTAEDIRPFWTDPLDAGPDVYIDRIKSVIDDVMEHVL
jgi:hypothetical protein